MARTALCWSCGEPDVCALVCPACKTLQRPPEEYFQFFGIPEKLQIDEADLQKRFYDLSRQLHPDRFTLKSDPERLCSLEATSILNDGYRTLRDPVKRAEYVLKLHGVEIGEQRGNDVPPELLEEVFELNEALEEIRGGDEGVRPQLVDAAARFGDLLAGVDGDLQAAFTDYDNGGGAAGLSRIRALLNRRKYIQNLVSEVQKELATHSVQ